jgi:hypothetical protein
MWSTTGLSSGVELSYLSLRSQDSTLFFELMSRRVTRIQRDDPLCWREKASDFTPVATAIADRLARRSGVLTWGGPAIERHGLQITDA